MRRWDNSRHHTEGGYCIPSGCDGDGDDHEVNTLEGSKREEKDGVGDDLMERTWKRERSESWKDTKVHEWKRHVLHSDGHLLSDGPSSFDLDLEQN